MAITGMDYAISWSAVANINPYTHADFTAVTESVLITGGNIKPAESGYVKFAFTGEAMDWTKTTMKVRVVLGDGPMVYSDEGGPAFLVPSGTDKGKGYYLRHYGNELRLHKIDTEIGQGSWAWTVGNINTATGSDAATGGELDLELSGIGAAPVFKAYYDGTQIGSSYAPSSYISGEELVPALLCIDADNNNRGWTDFGVDGLNLGGFTLDDVNGDNVVDHDTAFTINGDFSAVTITSVKIKQTGAAEKTVSFSEGDAALTCTAIDFHTTEIFDGAATIDVTDGIDTLTLDVTIDFSGEYDTTIATSIDAVKGVFRDITSPAVGHYLHSTPLISTSAVTPRSDGPFAEINPAVATGSTATWWHGNPTTRVWTAINLTINVSAAVGPVWDIAMPAWNLVEGIPDTLDVSDRVTAGSGSLDSWAVNPITSGITINSAGVLSYDGTIEPGSLWVAVDVADDDATNTSPQIAITVEANQLAISNDRVTSITQQTATITVDAAAAVGDIFVALRTSGAYTSSDIDEIKNGTGAAWFQDRAAALTLPFYVTGADSDTLYYYGIVQSDGALDSNVLADSFTTQADITYTETGKAPAPRPY